MAALKYYLVSTDMPDQFQHPLLVAIEGDAAWLKSQQPPWIAQFQAMSDSKM